MTVTMRTAAERPDLWERGIPSAAVWPTLPDSIDAAIEQSFIHTRAGEPMNTLCAVAAARRAVARPLDAGARAARRAGVDTAAGVDAHHPHRGW
ncbi:hypothetical protein ACIA5D_34435 [Actinoplanes sp. NPDC051513]|uniref:hypothetical protein n=1 Tax=Actinoplanes sp. NPDC051513 TaxID=3363908 RepID=UPI0037A4A901